MIGVADLLIWTTLASAVALVAIHLVARWRAS